MRTRTYRRVLTGVLAALAVAVLAPVASASVTPTLTLDQSAGKTAGSTANLGMDLKFTDSGSDSPQQMSIQLPPGLLADAAVDGGACLSTADLTDSKCQVGTGTVTADPLSFPLLPISEAVTFDLGAAAGRWRSCRPGRQQQRHPDRDHGGHRCAPLRGSRRGGCNDQPDPPRLAQWGRDLNR